MKFIGASSVEEIRSRFDGDVERFSNLETGQTATMDAAYCLDLVAAAAARATTPVRAVLDVGCGAGNFALKLREHVPDAAFTLIDLSRPMLERAVERLRPSPATAHQADIRRIDFAAGSFDVILAAAVLHHLRSPAEWEQVMTSFQRWLRPGGSLWVFDLVAHDHPAIQDLLWEKYGAYLTALGGEAYRDRVVSYVVQEDTPTSVTYQIELARRVGFSRVDLLHKHACFAAYGAVK